MMVFSKIQRSLAVLAMTSFAAVALAQQPGKPMTAEEKQSVLESMGKIVTSNAFVPGKDFSKWSDFLAKSKESIEKATTHEEFADAINSGMGGFWGVSHIVLMTPKATKARVERKTVGIGIQVQLEEGGLRVVGVFAKTPAEEAKIEPGDLIAEGDGKKITTVGQLLGEEGTKVTVKILRPDGKSRMATLTRRKYSNVREDTINWLDKETVVVKVNTFDISYNRTTIDRIFADAMSAKRLVLDLRSNGGGVVFNMLHLLGYFLPEEKKIGTFINRRMVTEYGKEHGGDTTNLSAIAEWADNDMLRPLRSPNGVFKGKIAVLINGGTGSASEITAAALKEHLGASIVGTKSAGAVLVSIMGQMKDGWMLQYPLMDYLTYKGIRLEGNGVTPDVEAETPRFGDKDTGVEKALALIKRQELRDSRGSKPKRS